MMISSSRGTIIRGGGLSIDRRRVPPPQPTPGEQTASPGRLRTYGYGVRWTEPTGPEGSWLIEVLDSEGDLIDGGMGDNVDDAILGVIERLLPPER
jgi:hypothetical protein